MLCPTKSTLPVSCFSEAESPTSHLLGKYDQIQRAGVGLYNIIHWDWTILRAFSPHYWIVFLAHEGQDGWRLLGSIVLCITGACFLVSEKLVLNIPLYAVLSLYSLGCPGEWHACPIYLVCTLVSEGLHPSTIQTCNHRSDVRHEQSV